MLRVLIVDDDANAAHSMRRLLLRAGFSTEVVYSGEDALERLATFEAHMVITDFFMPGMHGAQLLTRIRHIAPSAIRVLMSASVCLEWAFTQDPTLALDTIDFFFEKPWNDKRLVADLLRLHTRGSRVEPNTRSQQRALLSSGSGT
ncbi:response regulator [Cystobacter fuscus]